MDFAAFKSAWRERPIIHLSEEVPADLLTPASVFLRLGVDTAEASFLLESVEAGRSLGRYSVIGIDPVETVTLNESGGIIRRGRTVRQFPSTDFLRVLRSRLPKALAHHAELNTIGLTGGWVGYFGYDCARLFERFPSHAAESQGHPWSVLGLYDRVIVFDHIRQTAMAVATVIPSGPNGKSPQATYDATRRDLARIAKRLRQPSELPELAPLHAQRTRSNMSRNAFHAGVHTFKRHIARGDIFQGVLSQRFSVQGRLRPFDVYRRLRRSNPSPYMYFLRCGELSVAGSSPETLVKKSGVIVETRPIAGTRPRGITAADDQLQEHSLKRSVKENAEHVMLVDLGRNDLGRVCRAGTIGTARFRDIEYYSHVMHMVSEVAGKTRSRVDALDVLAATFPAGTVSGAPKIRAMEIIDAVEPDRRGIYAGCLGYIDWYNNLDMAITIRTAVIGPKSASVQAGAGIVADSDPEREFRETCHKAAAPLAAIGGVPPSDE